MDILVYTPRITSRIQFVFSLFFKYMAKAGYRLTDDIRELENHEGPAINYSPAEHKKGLWFPPAKLLFRSGIDDEEPKLVTDQDLKGVFATPKNPWVKFDIFASAFYFVTRYEEYLPHLRDLYNRFNAQYSFAFRHGFLDKPMVNYYAGFLFTLLENQYPGFKIRRNRYDFLNTIDIDNAWAYREKGFIRTSGAIMKDLLNGNFENMKLRFSVLSGKTKDPYDNYEYLKGLQKKYGFKSLYFFLLGDYGLNDKNVPVWNKKLRSLIQSISDYAMVGIHPSFGSNDDPEKLKKEIARLNEITKFEVDKSRQHFLILNLPETYRRLIDQEITADFTMGFASEAGFRAGICVPYPFYDLDREEITNLMIHPFAVMEATLKFYMKLSPEEAISVTVNMIEEVKKVNGLFIGLWHNESLSETGIWKGWREVYEFMIREAMPAKTEVQ